jgi:hypothetical protein
MAEAAEVSPALNDGVVVKASLISKLHTRHDRFFLHKVPLRAHGMLACLAACVWTAPSHRVAITSGYEIRAFDCWLLLVVSSHFLQLMMPRRLLLVQSGP